MRRRILLITIPTKPRNQTFHRSNPHIHQELQNANQIANKWWQSRQGTPGREPLLTALFDRRSSQPDYANAVRRYLKNLRIFAEVARKLLTIVKLSLPS